MGQDGMGYGSDKARLDVSPLSALRGYWEALRKDGKVPDRARIDPRGIAPALENSFLLERIAPGVARFRLCGLALHDVMGMEPAGMPLSTLFEPASRSRLAPALERVFQEPAVLELSLEAERGIGRPALEGRVLILPLRDQTGEIRLAIGALVTAGQVGRQPRRFAVASMMAEAVPEGFQRPRGLRAWEQELAEDPAPFRPAGGSLKLPEMGDQPVAAQAPVPARPQTQARPGERPWLRLVSSQN